MKILHLIGAMFVVISVAVGACGQGCSGNWMTPGYVLWSGATADATHIYTSVIADGGTGGRVLSIAIAMALHTRLKRTMRSDQQAAGSRNKHCPGTVTCLKKTTNK
jgi:hypothetical protein